jgi:branched-chain amino acid transport system permease protein
MRLFLLTLLNGATLGALYFIVASGFTLIFGLMRNVNLAHGSLYLLGGYLGYVAIALTDSWLAGLLAAFVAIALVGIALQVLVFRRMEGQDLRQTLVTIALSIVLADVMLWIWGGGFYQIQTPEWLYGAVRLPVVVGATSSGEPVYLQYPMLRLFILALGIVVGLLLWLMLNRTRIGLFIRAGVDDGGMLSVTGVDIQLVFVLVFALGAGLAGVGGVIGGTFQAIAPGEDVKTLLASLVVVIVGGMGSVVGTAFGAVLIGLAEQIGSVYMPTYSVILTFLIMVLVLAFRPQGIMGARQ